MHSQLNVGSRAPETVTIPIEGMSCAFCVGRVERVLQSAPGVATANVNLATERATIEGSADAQVLMLAVPGPRFCVKTIPALLRGAPDMNSLVAVGTLPAYLLSLVASFLPQLLPAGTVKAPYEAAAVIVTSILAGRCLEARAMPAIYATT